MYNLSVNRNLRLCGADGISPAWKGQSSLEHGSGNSPPRKSSWGGHCLAGSSRNLGTGPFSTAGLATDVFRHAPEDSKP